MFCSNVFKLLLAVICMVICNVQSKANDRCLLGTRDYEILAKRKDFTQPIKFPWSVDIYQFHYFRGHGAIISSKHILASASHILPYKGSEVETKDNGDCLANHYWVEHTTIYISASRDRKIDHVYVHPDYNPITYDNNVAVMEVDQLIPLDSNWLRPVFLPKTPLTVTDGKINIAFPLGTALKPYMAAVMSDDECAQINGNTNVSTNTLMCIEDYPRGEFSQPIFSIIPDGSIEIIGLPLWSKKELQNGNGKRTVSVYNRIANVVPWIEDILSKRCEHEPATPIDCTQKLLFAKSCEKLISTSSVAHSNGGFLNSIANIFMH